MKKIISILLLTIYLLLPQVTLAGFPDDLDDVVFIEEGNVPGLTNFMRTIPATAALVANVSGAHPFAGLNVILNYNRTLSWPGGGGDLACCNANAWFFAKVGDTWYGGTWEFLRIGQTIKSSSAIVGPRHLRFPPLQSFVPQNGEIYGFMVSGITRNGLGRVNIAERSNISLFRWGVGPATFDEVRPETEPEPEATKPIIAPIIDLLSE